MSTARRVVAFQLHRAGPHAERVEHRAGGAPVTYTVTTTPICRPYPRLRARSYSIRCLDHRARGAFGTGYEMVLRGGVEADIEKLAWYRQRLLVGYLSPTEMELPDLRPYPDGAAPPLTSCPSGRSSRRNF